MSGALNVLLATIDESGGGGGGGGALIVTASPGFISGFNIDSQSQATVYGGEPAIVSFGGGVPPFTCLWTYVSGDTEIIAETPTQSHTYFRAFFSGPGFYDAVWKCVVTDAASTVMSTNNVTISLQFEQFQGGGIFV